jgi:hypothetical protein
MSGTPARLGRPVRVALYARVSTRDKDQDPELQLDAMRDYVRTRGWEAVEYVDTAAAGDLVHRSSWTSSSSGSSIAPFARRSMPSRPCGTSSMPGSASRPSPSPSLTPPARPDDWSSRSSPRSPRWSVSSSPTGSGRECATRPGKVSRSAGRQSPPGPALPPAGTGSTRTLPPDGSRGGKRPAGSGSGPRPSGDSLPSTAAAESPPMAEPPVK